MLWQSLVYFLDRGTLGGFWKEIEWSVMIFQGAAVLEVISFCEIVIVILESFKVMNMILFCYFMISLAC